ncbi:hypothetical protein ACJX0J_013324, partial [Zea mays]
ENKGTPHVNFYAIQQYVEYDGILGESIEYFFQPTTRSDEWTTCGTASSTDKKCLTHERMLWITLSYNKILRSHSQKIKVNQYRDILQRSKRISALRPCHQDFTCVCFHEYNAPEHCMHLTVLAVTTLIIHFKALGD